MNASIRKLSLGDYTRVTAPWRSCEGVGLTDADSREGFLDLLRRNPGLGSVTAKDHQIVDSALCGHDGRRGLIDHLAVVTHFRCQGTGRALVEHSLAGHRCHKVVYSRNQSGRRLWRSIG